MGEMFLEAIKDLTKTEGLFEAIALLYKKQYDELITVGFTAEQAMQIIVTSGGLNMLKK